MSNWYYSYQWIEDGTDISGATNSTYSVSKAVAGSHTYNCRAISTGCSTPGQDGNSSTGSWASVPSVDVTPDGETSVYAGVIIIFSAAAAGGTVPYSYQWTENGSDISGATNSSYGAIKYSAGSFVYNCKVYSTGCSTPGSDASSSTGTWTVAPAPTVDVTTPDGGNTWQYSPTSSQRLTNAIQWVSSSSNGFSRTRVSYTGDGGTTWTCIADSSGTDCSAGSLLPGSQNFAWSMPTMEEAYAAGQTFPTTNAKVKVEVWNTTGQKVTDTSASVFTIANPTVPAVKTLIITDSLRMDAKYPGQWSGLSTKLAQLAAHTEVSGVVLDLKDAPGLATLYSTWDGKPTGTSPERLQNISAANDVANAVRSYVLSKVSNIFTGTQYLVIAGDDRIVP